MSRALLVLLIACLSCWVFLALPAALLFGPVALACSGVALVLCLVPAAFTLALGWGMEGQNAAYQLGVVLGGTGLRMFGVLGAGLAIYLLVPSLHGLQFWIWIIVFYLLTLAVEMRILLVGVAPARARAETAVAATPTTSGASR
jgi:hypothetical protein